MHHIGIKLIYKVIFVIQEKVGKRIKELRLQLGISQEELAARANLDRTYITSVERGRRNISIGTLEKIVLQLDCTMHDFFNF